MVHTADSVCLIIKTYRNAGPENRGNYRRFGGGIVFSNMYIYLFHDMPLFNIGKSSNPGDNTLVLFFITHICHCINYFSGYYNYIRSQCCFNHGFSIISSDIRRMGMICQRKEY